MSVQSSSSVLKEVRSRVNKGLLKVSLSFSLALVIFTQRIKRRMGKKGKGGKGEREE